MAARPQTDEPRPAPRLYLITPKVRDVSAVMGQLQSISASADIAAVLLRLPSAAESDLVATINVVAQTVQSAGIALVLDGHADIVSRSGADGAHLTGIRAFQSGVEQLKPGRIVGAGGLTTRHDAMLAAEADADYVMFGDPDLEGKRPSLTSIEERVAWWAEVFEPPCVAMAAALDEIAPLVAAGADFIAVGDCIWSDPAGPLAAICKAEEQLKTAEKVQ